MRGKSLASWFMLGLFGIVCTLSIILWIGCGENDTPSGPETLQETIIPSAPPQDVIRAVMAIQDRHTARLMANPDVVGTATGLTEDGKPAILVFAAKNLPAEALPNNIEGVPVEVKVTGELFALGKPGGDRIDPTKRFPRPVPIGVSTGNEGECSAGTIGCRVKDAGNVYALSNNHVYALENKAPTGSNVLQPGLYDTGCAFDPNNVIGTLSAFEPIVFSTSANNTIDAAISASSTANLGNATPSNGYGMPKSATFTAALGQAVQKYGRTSSLTQGQVTGINATVNVGYSSGTARFVDQIIVQARKPFIKAGDSGSLLVTDPDRNPVGLLFAGTQDGKLAVANRIDLVLTKFNVTVDGE
ncbi:hypothetical protein HYR99_12190 [Candidatus Poribacteria bacterium]|nr:hypothetical protein [Candidatus Poribacteria bacterium]